ncbi:hypothetical protein RFI_27661 [Reticulomyxa filosa]|uniref:Hyaluronan/mRNA-binding protein domain-containing protein n=1 Tax=Reticulomyxa filosa TaxID=46433 RepID=X6M7U1_RETFI|nr:hypothetical protein RFI_27661 [Reticulomyxa filosa]|eukprot:ETO09716.1 hypothetical protein RFI_27661 [Reticulomyxa filosa]
MKILWAQKNKYNKWNNICIFAVILFFFKNKASKWFLKKRVGKTKREHDRHSGTGQAINDNTKRGGGGGHNWGDASEQIRDAVDKHVEEDAAVPKEEAKAPKKDELDPQNYGDLATTEKKDLDVSYEEYMKQKQKSGKKAYDTRTVTNHSLTADRAQQRKKKRKKPKKQQKLIQPEYSFLPARYCVLDYFLFFFIRKKNSKFRESGRPERDSRRDSDRGGRGRGGDRERGDGFGRGGGRGFGDNRGGFGSRGRGRRNDASAEFENRSGVPQPHRPQPQYRLKNDANNAGNVNAPNQQHAQGLPPQSTNE